MPRKPPSKPHTPTSPAQSGPIDAVQQAALRDLFWHNVAREMLTGLSVLCQQQPELFDGRFAILTTTGSRIPIGVIYPLFACSVPGSGPEHNLSLAVQCTVFRVQTPEGEVFTLPVQEVRALHALTPELVERMQAAAKDGESQSDESNVRVVSEPFGLAAFAALPKISLTPKPAPEHPTE